VSSFSREVEGRLQRVVRRRSKAFASICGLRSIGLEGSQEKEYKLKGKIEEETQHTGSERPEEKGNERTASQYLERE
jgi:hypothetical protein